ncbi:cation/H(+) symporter 13-like [Chenopodium quinoa]|nr:cation/H(+) symporter 13-like [Chenopodium quinoa]
MAESTEQWWSQGIWNDTTILCEQVEPHKVYKGFWENELYLRDTYTSTILCNLSIILGVTTFTWYLLKPLQTPLTSQMIGGVLVMGLLFSNRLFEYNKLLPPTVLYVLETMSSVGFVLQLFMVGLETNMSVIIRRLQLKSIIISLSGLALAYVFSALAILATNEFKSIRLLEKPSISLLILVALNAQTFFMVTCHNLNDLGISNSDIGRMASSIALIPDLVLMVTNLVMTFIVPPFFNGSKLERRKAFITLGYYILVFLVFRPIVLYIISQTPEGRNMRNSHFMYIFLVVLIVAWIGEVLNELLPVFLFSLTLPEHPLSSVFSAKLEAITSCVFFPLYCAMQGLKTDFFSLTKRAYELEFLLIVGYIGKFLGTSFTSRLYGVPFWNSLALSFIISSKGLLDVAAIGIIRDKGWLNVEEYTLAMFHFLILTGALLPLVRLFYEPLSQYTSIFRPSVTDSTNSNTFQTLTCLYKEDNLPGIIRLIEAFHPTRTRPIPVILLQLMPLTGRCTMPIMAPLDYVKSLPMFRSKIAFSNRIVESFLNLERESKGYTRLKHYISISTYETMHNDICSLAYEKDASLLILPFHLQVQWTKVGKIIEDSSLSIREVNKMVLEKAPCSVALLLDRADPHLGIIDTNIYQVAIIFIGGVDDLEALAFTRLFGNHPHVKAVVLWLKSPNQDRYNALNNEVIKNFQASGRMENERLMTLKEVIVNDGADTTNVLLSMNGVIDLVVVGRHHDFECAPLYGLSFDGFCEYPELGILGDLLATPDFGFSVLVVQQEPKDDLQVVYDKPK